LDFCGIFAISVDASLLRRTVATARTVTISGPRRARETHAEPRKLREGSQFYRPDFILSPWQCEGNHAGKEFFIIVNPLLTMKTTGRAADGRRMMAVELRPRCGRSPLRTRRGADAVTALLTIAAFAGRKLPPGGPAFT
jgi:hypothetical protein